MAQKPQKEPTGEIAVSVSAAAIAKPEEEIEDDALMRKIRQMIQEEMGNVGIAGKAGQAGAEGAPGAAGADGEKGDKGDPGEVICPSSFRWSVYKVISAATGDGVYNCNSGELDASEWSDTSGDPKLTSFSGPSLEVLNLLENHVNPTYARALAYSDKIFAWRVLDNVADVRWIGIPLVPSVRKVITTEAAPASDHITCNLFDEDDAEITSGLGSGIEVYANICGGVNLDAATPRIADNDVLIAVNIKGKWYFTTTFWPSFYPLDVCA